MEILIIIMIFVRMFMLMEEFSPWRVYLRRAKTPIQRIYAVTLMVPVLGEFTLLMYGLFRMVNWIFENSGDEE